MSTATQSIYVGPKAAEKLVRLGFKHTGFEENNLQELEFAPGWTGTTSENGHQINLFDPNGYFRGSWDLNELVLTLVRRFNIVWESANTDSTDHSIIYWYEVQDAMNQHDFKSTNYGRRRCRSENHLAELEDTTSALLKLLEQECLDWLTANGYINWKDEFAYWS